jgi:hypothetical protein
MEIPMTTRGTPAILLSTGSKATKREVFRVEPVVGPKGEFHEARVDIAGGHRLVREVEGQVVLTLEARQQGWTLYRDMCFGQVPGVEPSIKHWKTYELLRDARKAGRLPEHAAISAEKMYHPEVIRRRTSRVGGFERFTAEDFDAALAQTVAEFEDSISPAERRRIAARARELDIGDPDSFDDKALRELLED